MKITLLNSSINIMVGMCQVLANLGFMDISIITFFSIANVAMDILVQGSPVSLR